MTDPAVTGSPACFVQFRPVPLSGGSPDFAEALAARGFALLHLPLQSFAPAAPEALSIRPDDLLVVTSRTAVDALSRQGLSEALKHLPVLCVGRATADAAWKAGFTAVMMPDGPGNASGLLTKLRSLTPVRVLYLRGETVSLDLKAALAGEIPAEDIICYRTGPRIPTLAELNALAGRLEHSPQTTVFSFWSAGSVQAFTEILLPRLEPGLLMRCPAIAISDSVADRCPADRFASLQVAASPDAAGILALLES